VTGRFARLGAVAAVLIAVTAFWLVDQLARAPQSQRLLQAHVGQTPDEDGGRAVTLPHRWRDDEARPCTSCTSAWYRFDIPLAVAPADPQLLWLPSIGRNAAIYLNGQLIVQGGRFSAPAARLGTRSLTATTPAALWNPGLNRLYVLVQSDPPYWGAMPVLALGPESSLSGALGWRGAVTVTWPQVSAAAAVMLALVMALIWLYRRHQQDHAAAAAASALYALFAFTTIWVEPPWNDAAWDLTLAGLSIALSGAVMVLSTRLVSDAPWGPRARGSAVALALAAVGATVLVALDGSGLALSWMQRASTAALGLTGFGLAWAAWRRDRIPLSAAGALLALAAIADLTRAGVAADGLPALLLGLSIVLGTAAWHLLLHFVQSLNAVELLKIDLEALVADRTQALQTQFDRVRDLERQQIVAGERERLMRDMHDGVGGHLVSMLAMIEADRRRPAELATVVREALTDMRLLIDSLEPVDDDLNAVLAMFHDRLAPRLRATGVVLHWDVDLLPPVPGLTPARVLHVLRVLQEAVTNAIRHGEAKTLWMRAQLDPDTASVRLTVRDDGHGFDAATPTSGRGLKNMQRRMAEIGATLSIHSSPGQGATVHIALGPD
jgi:signal transduction histidine kinase